MALMTEPTKTEIKVGDVFDELPGKPARRGGGTLIYEPLLKLCMQQPGKWRLIKTGALKSLRATKSNLMYGRFRVPEGEFRYEVLPLETEEKWETLGYDPDVHAGLFAKYVGPSEPAQPVEPDSTTQEKLDVLDGLSGEHEASEDEAGDEAGEAGGDEPASNGSSAPEAGSPPDPEEESEGVLRDAEVPSSEHGEDHHAGDTGGGS